MQLILFFLLFIYSHSLPRLSPSQLFFWLNISAAAAFTFAACCNTFCGKCVCVCVRVPIFNLNIVLNQPHDATVLQLSTPAPRFAALWIPFQGCAYATSSAAAC